MLEAAAAVDRMATRAAYAGSARRRQGNRAEALDHGARMDALARLEELYADRGDDWFRAPREIAPRAERVRRLADGVVEDLRWSSDFAPWASGVAERYLRGRENRHAAARLWRHARTDGRPAMVLVHGYLGGHHAMELSLIHISEPTRPY